MKSVGWSEQILVDMSVEQKQSLRQAWLIAGVSTALLLLLTLVLYRQTVQYLTGLWNDYEIGNYGHGYLVLAIAAYLIVRNRRRLLGLTPCPSIWVLSATIAASLLWLVAVLVDVNMMQTVALWLLVITIVWSVLGNHVTRLLLLPLLYVGFALPIWFPLSPLLQDVTADVVFWVIRLLELPAFREENRIIVPAGVLSVEEACAGLRYLLAALTLGTLYAYLNYQTLRARIIVVLVAAAAGILVNMVRVFIVVYLGYATDMQHPYVQDHMMLGWYLFGGLVAILLFADALLYRHYHRDKHNDKSGQYKATEVNTQPAACPRGNSRYLATVILGALVLAAGPAAVYSINHQSPANEAKIEIVLPAGRDGWSGPLTIEDDWAPVYQKAIALKQAYNKADDQAIVYLGYYPAQKQGGELINDLNSINNPDVWMTHYAHAHLQKAGDQHVLEQLLKKSNGEQRLVWYWYRVAGRETTNKYEAKLLQALGLLTGQKHASVAAVATQKHDDIDHARKVLDEFLAVMKKPLQQIPDTYE